MFNYSIDIKDVPQVIKRGRKAEATVSIINPTKKIQYCAGRIKEYNIQKKLSAKGNNSFYISGGIPIIAPKGKYAVELFAVSQDGEEGPKREIIVEII